MIRLGENNIYSTQIEKIGLEALNQALHIYKRLGTDGRILVTKKKGTDVALKMDIEAEQAVLDVLEASSLSFLVHSEEHGTLTVGDNPTFTATLDGLDGTSNYKKNDESASGTMLAILSGTDPKYSDTVFAGMMMYPSEKLYYVSTSDKIKKLHKGVTHFDNRCRVFVDTAFDEALDVNVMNTTFVRPLTQAGIPFEHESASTAEHFARIIDGTLDITCEATRGNKGNFELPVGYALLKSNGGVLMCMDGTLLDNKKYLEFGHDEYIPLIGASTMQLAQEFVKHLQI